MKPFTRSLAVAIGIALAGGMPVVARAQASQKATSTDPTTFTIAQAQAAFKSGSYSSEKLTRAFLDRIGKYDPYYNAFTRMNPTALDEARAVDKRRAAGEALGPLAGIPVVVKDFIDMAGLPTTGGWSGLASSAGGVDLIPEHDAPVVQRLRAAGAVIFGKTNLPIFARSGDNANDSFHGPTFNVVNRHWAPGGSSTGTATAVAADFAIAGIAEETGGSIQNPASAQSLVGIKPTFALVPNSGGIPQAGSTRDVFGPIAKTVEDAAIMLDVLAGYSLDDPKTNAAIGNIPESGYAKALSSKSLKGARIGLYGPGWRTAEGALTPETQALYARAVTALKAKGAIIVEDPFAGSGFAELAKLDNSYDARGSEELAYELDQYLQHLGKSAAVHSLAELEQATDTHIFASDGPLASFVRLPGLAHALANPTAVPDMTEFARLRAQYLRIFNRVMAEKHVDAFFFPQETAPIGDVFDGKVASSTVSEINISGLPGVVLPSGKYSGGQPFSLIFVGPMWSEATLVSYAHDLEGGLAGRVVNRALETTPGPHK